MGKSKQKPSVDTFTEDIHQNKDCVRTVSYIIIAFCIMLLLGLLGLMACRATKNNPEVYRVIATSDISPDSLKTYTYINYKQLDSLINAVVDYDAQLIQKYQYLVEQKEQDSQVFYWGSLIVGIVVAVFGWFGFQSFTTIEDKAKKKATVIAKRTAWRESKDFLDEKGKQLVEESAKSNLQEEVIKKVKEQVLSELNSIIEKRIELYKPDSATDDLLKRIEDVEASLNQKIDQSVRGAVLDIIDKIKKFDKDDLKNKEGKK